MENKLKVTLNGKALVVEKGTRLAQILEIDKPCGGHGTCGKCKVSVNGRDELACQYIVESDIDVRMYDRGEIASVSGVEESGSLTENLCYALDIGTTTIALALVSLDTKSVVRVITATNPQRQFGADVMSRIEYCRRETVTGLHSVLIREINRMIGELGVKTVDTLYVAANLTMLHTFFGIDCSSMGVAPYTPAFLDRRTAKASEIGIRGVENIVSLPSISSFVGADIVAGLRLVGMPEKGKYNLLIDLGTNAEVVLYSSRGGFATAAAAGPCFEGANISCGMSATDGAVSAYKLNYGHAEYKTISDAPACGICGTGLIDIIAALLKNEIIDESGYMEEDYYITSDVYLSAEDVRQYQLAKSAVASAVLSLMRTENIGYEDISRVYISGGFSAKIDLVNVAYTGLLPRELALGAVALNNSSLQGTVRYACEGGNLDEIAKKIRYIDLSSSPYFAELFMENMMF